MQVIRQDNDCIDDKWTLSLGHAKRRAKRANLIDKRARLTFRKRHGEEIGSAL